MAGRTPELHYQAASLMCGLQTSSSLCVVYLDDILVFGKTVFEHNSNLTQASEVSWTTPPAEEVSLRPREG